MVRRIVQGSVLDSWDIQEIKIKHGATLIFSNVSSCSTTGLLPTSILNKYSDYTNFNILLKRGDTYTFVIKFEYCYSSVYRSPYLTLNFPFPRSLIYFDYLNTGALTFQGPYYYGLEDSVVFAITMPTNTTVGNSRMRFSSIYINSDGLSTGQSSCGTYTGGEVEDYTVHFCEPLTYSFTIENPLCYNDTTGKLDITSTGGTAPVQYRWDSKPYQTSPNFSNLSHGYHYLSIRDSIGCEYKDSFYLFNPNPLTASLVVDSTCNGDSIGRITINATGGADGYQYSLDNGAYQSFKMFEDLSAGKYILRVKDTNGCLYIDSTTIHVKTYPVINYSVVLAPINCYNRKDGKITINASNALTPYAYKLNTGAIQSSNIFQNIDSGNHQVRIYDSKGCYKKHNFRLVNPSKLQTNILYKTDLKCWNQPTGAAKVKTTGGRLPESFSYSWSTGSTLDSIANQNTGIYRVTATNTYGCRDSLSLSIGHLHDSLYLDYRILDTVRCGYDSIGRVKLIGIGGLSPYRYEVNGNGFQFDSIYTNLKPSNLTVRVQDAEGCITSMSIVKPYIDSPLVHRVQYDTMLCYGLLQTMARFIVQNGTSPIMVNLDSQGWSTALDYPYTWTNRMHSYSIRDANNCKFLDSFYIKTFSKNNTQIQIDPNQCHNDSLGVIRVIGTTGQFPPYTYCIDAVNYSTNKVYSHLKNGLYYLYTKDSMGCALRDSAIIYSLSRYQYSVHVTDNVCAKEHKGQVQIRDMNSTHPVLYSIASQGFTGANTWTGLGNRQYTVQIKYDSFCKADTVIYVQSPDSMQHSIIQTPIQCYGAADGKLSIYTIEGTAPYINTLYASNTKISYTPHITNIDTGTNQLLVIEDKNQCRDSFYYSFSNPPKVSLSSVQKTDVLCYGDKTGVIIVSYNHNRNDLSLYFDYVLTQDTQFLNLKSATYHIRLQDSNRCTDSIYVHINQPAKLKLKIDSISKVVCYGYSDGYIRVISEGGTTPYRYIWNTGNTESSASSLAANMDYTIRVTDSNQCGDSLMYRLRENPSMKLTIKKKDVVCYNTNDGAIQWFGQGGTPYMKAHPYRYNINNQPVTKNQIFNLTPNRYRINMKDSLDCGLDTIVEITAPDRVRIYTDSVVSVAHLGDRIQLATTVSNNAVRYQWYPEEGLSCVDCPNPVFNGYISQRYRVVIHYQEGQCADSAHTFITVPNSDIYIPNSFSPTGCHYENRIFKVYGKAIRQTEIMIFNRWGEKIHESTDPLKGWDGFYLGELQPFGVYSYYVRVILLNGHKMERQGTVLLVR